MSNNHSIPSKKIIQIKSPNYFYNEKSSKNLVSEEVKEMESIQSEITLASKQLEQLKNQREKLLQTTKMEIETEKKNWEKEKLSLVQQAKDEGYTAGFSSGKEEGLLQYKELIEKVNVIVQTATEEYHAAVEKSNEAILLLAIHTAERILNVKLDEDPAKFIHIVKQAIKELKDQSMVSIYLHPSNYHYVLEQKEELSRTMPSDMRLELYVKEDLHENACVIEHPFGRIDASVDTQLKQVYDILLDIAQES
ncbi:flagellar assembly protein FliH [Oceanobacillus halophilus]|uniref:flagellar assembly protein FliH n=1 Tax=Oceanobacillus halophilus TaxID=930130 RepID=UPI001314462E|nr:flagellar assembly protein FliH [Oceanobacillus halophilus]